MKHDHSSYVWICTGSAVMLTEVWSTVWSQFEPTISEGERSQNHALDRANTGIVRHCINEWKLLITSKIIAKYFYFISEALLYRVSQEECARLREGVPYVKVYRYNPKHLCPKLNGYGDNGQRKVWSLVGPRAVPVSWQSYPHPSLSVVSYYGNSAHCRSKLLMYFLLGDKALHISAWQSCHV